MNVTAMLAWYDEPPGTLHECVTSLATIADTLIAFDGAWHGTPGGQPASDPEQHRAITQAAANAGLDFMLLEPRTIWPGQVAKRNAILQVAQEDSDWVIPVDADWVLHGDRQIIRQKLADTKAEQLYVRFWQPEGSDDFAHDWHRDYAGETRLEPMVLRVLQDMRCERLHYAYSGVRPDGERVGLKGGSQFYREASSDFLPLLVEHRCMFRDTARIERNRAYLADREAERAVTGVER